MAKINVNDIATESQGKTFEDFVDNFQENIQNLGARQSFSDISSNRDYTLDEDGYIIGDVWSEAIASEIMDLNGFVATNDRLEALIEGRKLFQKASLSTNHAVIADKLGMDSSKFLKLFPKYPIIYFTRWGNMRKPFNLKELIDNPVRR
jgi:sulfur relay (sulfurtransferase) DsrC/TusE family protein